MAEANEPIKINIPGEGVRYVFFEESYVWEALASVNVATMVFNP